jgi:hypothetical protein
MLRIAADLPRRGNTVAVLTAPRYHTSTAEHDLRPVALSETPIPERPAKPHSVPRTGFRHSSVGGKDDRHCSTAGPISVLLLGGSEIAGCGALEQRAVGRES